MSKVCSNCKQDKPLEHFQRKGKDRLCKPCRSVYTKAYREKNKDKVNSYMKKYRDKDKNKQKQYVKNHRSKMTPGVYLIKTPIGNYVGQSKEIEARIRYHNRKDSPVSKTKINSWLILEEVKEKKLRLERESFWIDKLKPELNTKHA